MFECTFVAEGDWGWSDWGGGGGESEGCVGLSQGKGDGKKGDKGGERR